MNRGRGQQPRARGQTRVPNARASMGALKSSLHGHENKLRSTNPPSVNQTPFNTIVVAEDIPGTGTFVEVDLQDIDAALRNQLYLDGNDVLRIKVQRIDFWSLADAVTGASGTFSINPKIEARFYSLVQSIGQTTPGTTEAYPIVQKELDDIGLSGQAAAKVSYSYPRAQADLALKPPPAGQGSFTPALVALCKTQAGCTVKARYHLHWCTVPVDSEPAESLRAVKARLSPPKKEALPPL